MRENGSTTLCRHARYARGKIQRKREREREREYREACVRCVRKSESMCTLKGRQDSSDSSDAIVPTVHSVCCGRWRAYGRQESAQSGKISGPRCLIRLSDGGKFAPFIHNEQSVFIPARARLCECVCTRCVCVSVRFTVEHTCECV